MNYRIFVIFVSPLTYRATSTIAAHSKAAVLSLHDDYR